MKKTILAALLIATGNSFIWAQDSVPAIAFENTRLVRETRNPVAPNNNGFIRTENVSPKVMKDFSKTCKSAADCRWYLCEKKGIIAFYQLGEKKGRRFYNQKGNYVYNILSYGEASLPRDVRDLVKRTYYLDYHIDLVEEIETTGKTFFIVHISDDKTIKTVSVFEGEINLMQDLVKSK
jgi:hypothetical protein